MTFNNAISYLTDGTAAKDSTWAGYIMAEAETGDTGKFFITFVPRSASANPTKNTAGLVVGKYDPATGSITGVTSGAAITLDDQFLTALAGSNWVVGSTSDFEKIRKPAVNAVW